MKYISIICSVLLLILCGCSEKEEVVIKKTENIPQESISEETIPLIVLMPKKKIEPAQEETTQSKTVSEEEEEDDVEIPQPAESFVHETQISENISEQTKIVQKPAQVIKKKTTAEITKAKSPVFTIPGECLVYRIKWNFASVGKVILVCKKEQINKQDVYHLVALTAPEGLWTKFGYGYNRFDSYIDSRTNLPFYYYGYSASSSKSQITKTTIDQNKKTLTYEIKKYKAEKQYGSKNGSIKFSDTLYDGLSVLYAMRGIACEQLPPTIIPVGITKITTIFLSFLEKNISDFYVGTRSYWLFQSEAKEEAIFSKGKLFVSISADNEKLPLLFKGKVPLGTGTVEIISKKNLGDNFPTDSKYLTEIMVSTQ